jgi:NAD(P)-dependent dehydrogenase (short-subunit alcohol dehydrogenase family)
MSSIDGHDLTGQVALVTGGGSGIGAATSRALAARGAAVAVTDLAGDSAERVATTIEESDGRAVAHVLDVADENHWAAVVRQTEEVLGPITILHGNAAPTSGELIDRDLDVVNIDPSLWDAMMAVVVHGNMLGCKHVIPSMLAAGGGSIILTTSIKGRVGSTVRTAYSVAKAGLDQLVRMVATEYGAAGIRCNGIAPGIIASPGLHKTVSEEYLAALLAGQLLPRLGTPEDIAAAVVFLASPASSFITAQTLVVDGGMSAFVPALSPKLLTAHIDPTGAVPTPAAAWPQAIHPSAL